MHSSNAIITRTKNSTRLTVITTKLTHDTFHPDATNATQNGQKAKWAFSFVPAAIKERVTSDKNHIQLINRA